MNLPLLLLCIALYVLGVGTMKNPILIECCMCQDVIEFDFAFDETHCCQECFAWDERQQNMEDDASYDEWRDKTRAW